MLLWKEEHLIRPAPVRLPDMVQRSTGRGSLYFCHRQARLSCAVNGFILPFRNSDGARQKIFAELGHSFAIFFSSGIVSLSK